VALDPTEFTLRAMLEETLRILTPRAQSKGLSLSWTTDRDVAAVVVGDPDRLRQVLVNLIGNAIKFTPLGEVTLQVSTASPPEAPLVLRFAVRDSGIGIAPGQQGAIFDAFVQADGSASRQFGGTGLGLAICRELVALMGGEIGVESAPGSGSTFHFTACFGTARSSAPVLAPMAPALLPSRLGRLRILLAEDNVVNQRLAVRLLEKRGHSVAVAVNGYEALAALERETFDLVLMDVQMPGMGGLETTAEIRRRELAGGSHVHLPIVAMTAHAMSGDRERCLGAGMDGYVAKPIQTAVLLAAIEAVFGAAAAPAPLAAAANG
jgi:CheY-like chemotaxis protein